MIQGVEPTRVEIPNETIKKTGVFDKDFESVSEGLIGFVRDESEV
jgi:hypothetical protein